MDADGSGFEKLLKKSAPPRPLPYPLARIGTGFLVAGVFYGISLLVARIIGAALRTEVLQPTHAYHFWAVGLVCAAFFAGHSATVGMMDALLQGRLTLPPSAALPAPAKAAHNPWAVAVSCACLWGAPAAAISCWIVSREWPNGVPVIDFAYQFAAAVALLSAGVVLVRIGTPFLAQAQLGPEQRRFAGTAAAYLWQRQILPLGLVNGAINAWVGAAIVPGSLGDPTSLVPAVLIQQDAVATAIGLALAVVGGAFGHARFDRRWQVMPQLQTRVSRATRVAVLIAWIAFAAALGSIPRALGVESVAPWTFVVARTLACVIFSAFLAYWMASWALATPDEAA